MIGWWTRRQRERRYRRFRDRVLRCEPVSIIDGIRVTSEWMQTVAEDFHRFGDHEHENAVHDVGRSWAEKVEVAMANGDIKTVTETSASATRAIGRIIDRTMAE